MAGTTSHAHITCSGQTRDLPVDEPLTSLQPPTIRPLVSYGEPVRIGGSGNSVMFGSGPLSGAPTASRPASPRPTKARAICGLDLDRSAQRMSQHELHCRRQAAPTEAHSGIARNGGAARWRARAAPSETFGRARRGAINRACAAPSLRPRRRMRGTQTHPGRGNFGKSGHRSGYLKVWNCVNRRGISVITDVSRCGDQT